MRHGETPLRWSERSGVSAFYQLRSSASSSGSGISMRVISFSRVSGLRPPLGDPNDPPPPNPPVLVAGKGGGALSGAGAGHYPC